MLEVKQVTYQYRTGADVVDALRGVNAEFYPGTLYAIMGRSGSGKSTLLSLLAGMDLPLSGEILINGKNLSLCDRDKYRRETVGMIFQSYYLLPHLTAAENIALSMELSGKNKGITKAEKQDKVESLLSSVGLTPVHGKKRATRLSGGEQ
ncbi:MAG: ATP-binding cassette domain-containing protein, partial [Clostridia bacterium]|nr:ATP-binding cassette domain-containing protein [Clostridia bacterium]